MNSLANKKIVLGISGSIAAYKAASLTRLLIKAGCEVEIIMTQAAQSFITPLTLSTLSKHPVHTNLFDGNTWDSHVELGLWADAFVVAPATATTLSKMANGIADNMLVASYLSAKCPVFFAPAMDLDMWKHPSTVKNIEMLEAYGNQLIQVNHGELASGLIGEGRMAEPEEIVQVLEDFFKKKLDLSGKRILVTAGPTYEDLDPVRFIGNNSSGKMGVAIAENASRRGAEVILVQGPGYLEAQSHIHKIVRVRSAQQMFDACHEEFNTCDSAIMAAAVADYSPAEISNIKIKKKERDLQIPLKRTKDIAASLGKIKTNNQILVGFALETNNAVENAKKKLVKKNFDFIVLNTLEDKGAGFKHDTNKVQFILKNQDVISFPLKSKKKVAEDIIDQVLDMF
jgi:phosphopantothenoylcysteine decarboxylase/phosphopantothenate--cysteine ligase